MDVHVKLVRYFRDRQPAREDLGGFDDLCRLPCCVEYAILI